MCGCDGQKSHIKSTPKHKWPKLELLNFRDQKNWPKLRGCTLHFILYSIINNAVVIVNMMQMSKFLSLMGF